AVAGDMLRGSLEVLAPFGRHVDIGKADVLRNEPMPLGVFDKGVTFSSFDLDLTADEPAVKRSLGEVVELFARDDFPSLPVTVFPAYAAKAAFATMARAEHVGKLALDMQTGGVWATRRAASVRSDATYLVTGGLRGFGLEIARFLVRAGARHLV